MAIETTDQLKRWMEDIGADEEQHRLIAVCQRYVNEHGDRDLEEFEFVGVHELDSETCALLIKPVRHG